MKWTRRLHSDSGILSDAIGYMEGRLTMTKYPDKIRPSYSGTSRLDESLFTSA